jgi:pimeloyl-ACP methyl ester carboxylesterase
MYQGTGLARRCSFGLEGARPPGGAPGLDVVRVLPDGAAARAGLFAGDRLVAVNGAPVLPTSIAAVARTFRPGDGVAFVVERAGRELRLSTLATPAPVERLDGADLELDTVDVGPHRLRMIRTTPCGAPHPRPTVLYLAGLGHATCELPDGPEAPERRFLEGLTALGFATARVERAGVGDSEGSPPDATDFFTEVAGYRAALERLRGDSGVGPIVLFGTSLGGMIAPLLAGEGAGVNGVVVFGTSARKWVDCILHATRRQRTLAGLSAPALDAELMAWAEIHARICRGGETPAEIFAARPELARFEGPSCRGRTIFGRDVAFFREIEGFDLRALWRTVDVPVLVLQGAFDWVCPREEGQSVVEACGPSARYVELPGIGHDMRAHATLERSFASPRAGVWNGAVIEAIRAWIADLQLEGQGSSSMAQEALSNGSPGAGAVRTTLSRLPAR